MRYVLSVCLSCPSVCLVRLFVLSVCLSVLPSVYLFACLSFPSVLLLSFAVSVCLIFYDIAIIFFCLALYVHTKLMPLQL